MSKAIDLTKHPSEWEPLKYNTIPTTYSKEMRRQKIDNLLLSNGYCFSEKKDGDLCRVVFDDGYAIAQSRTVSKKTGTYGDLTGKLLFMKSIQNAFKDTTVLLGEVYIPGGTAQNVGTILRCLDSKALARQADNPVHYYIFDVLYYEGQELTHTPIVDRIKYLPEICEKINNPLVSYAKYYNADINTFWDKLDKIFSAGGEGVVLYKKTMLPCEGRTSVWETVKVKRELELEADCIITGIEPPKKDYTGKELTTWQYWENTKTLEKLCGSYYLDYYNGGTLRPITKSYYYNWPGSIVCSVFNENDELVELCKCSNLTEELMCGLRDNFEDYYMKPCKVDGMSISYSKDSLYPSIRHPKFICLRDDIDIHDCLLNKIIGDYNGNNI